MAPILTRVGQAFGFGASTAGAGGGGVNPAVPGMNASGGIISDYEDGGKQYRSHTFTTSGSFVIADLSSDTFKNKVDYLVVGGGGGGGIDYIPNVGNRSVGGGGAGALFYGTELEVPATATWPIAIGKGAAGGGMVADAAFVPGQTGGNSVLTHPNAPDSVTAPGGGGGAGTANPGIPAGVAGGSGGGAASGGSAGGTGAGDSGHPGGIDVESPPNGWGNDGGVGSPGPASYWYGGGGGGGSALGTAATPTQAGPGGDGARYTIGNGVATYYAGGGGAGGRYTPTATAGRGLGGQGGGGTGCTTPSHPRGYNGYPGFGAGGGGKGNFEPYGWGSAWAGGSGVCIIRYQLGAAEGAGANTAKATGGNISFYNSKTIHTYTTSGTFVTPGSFSETCEYFIIAGGGSGGGGYAGAGGAGGYYTGTTPVGSSLNLTVTVGDGGKNSRRCSPSGTWSHGRGQRGDPSGVNFPADNLSADGGGFGAAEDTPTGYNTGQAYGWGGSGGGGCVGPGGSGNMNNPGPAGGNGLGHAGGSGWQAGDVNANAGGGGGGAGGTGNNGASSFGGHGGVGVQLPTTFRDPKSTVGMPGPGGGKWWVGGGGGGGHGNHANESGRGGGPGGPYAGGGNGAGGPGGTQYATDGEANTGGGGGAAGGGPSGGSGIASRSGRGGSGLVLIAYPTQDTLKSVTLNPFWMPGGVILCLFVNDYGINWITETTFHRILCMVHALGCSCYHFAF